MGEVQRVQGRDLSNEDINYISRLIKDHPSWSRSQLSQVICRQWNWSNAKGQIKDMAARTMLLKLEKLSCITLPPRRREPVNRMLQKVITSIEHDPKPIECSLRDIQPILVVSTWQEKAHEDLFACLVSRYHYLGYKGIVGENMKYVIFDCNERVLGCVLFGSSAWTVNSRDTYIGWNESKRQSKLHLITNNMRFLILPWVRIPHLASHVLGYISRRISADWEQRYGHPIYLLETFVEKDRFVGTCYKAANWIWVGETKGRSRNDRYLRLQVPIKDVYLYPTVSNFKKKLMA